MKKNSYKTLNKNIVKVIAFLIIRDKVILKSCQLIYALKLNIKDYILKTIWNIIPWAVEGVNKEIRLIKYIQMVKFNIAKKIRKTILVIERNLPFLIHFYIY